MIRHDITLNGSLIGEGMGILDTEAKAQIISLHTYPGRLIRVMDGSGLDVIAEFRNGEKLAA